MTRSCLSGLIVEDFIPLLISVKDNEIINSIVRILVNLSVPVECLLPVDMMSRSDVGRMTIFELNSFLISSKEAFLDVRTTRAIIDYMKKLLEMEEKKKKLSEEECESINDCLLLLRNVLHIPETRIVNQTTGHQHCTIQNQIVWNLFIQNIDKVMIHLMTCEQKSYWGVTMVQLIAVMYKDQHVGTLQKLLNIWFEASLSESSEDNESNTSPPDQGSEDSSPVMTSDFSDTGGSGKNMSTSNDECASGVPHLTQRSFQVNPQDGNKQQTMKRNREVPSSDSTAQHQSNIDSGNDQRKNSNSSSGSGNSSNNPSRKNSKSCLVKRTSDLDSGGGASICSSDLSSQSSKASSASYAHHVMRGKQSGEVQQQKRVCHSPSEVSDCGYATLGENPELASTSSNEEETPQTKRPIHQKPHISKTRYVNKQPTSQEKKELRRKKLVKRSKTTIMNMKAMANHVPSDEDITHLLKEFTVDFLLKAYGSLVDVLHSQLITVNNVIQMDTSHFFWLVTYFLKFSAQLELDLEHVREVLSYDIISYLTYEGVNICESLEIASRQDGGDLKPFLRRQHLVVTAIREFIQAVETYKKVTHLTQEDKDFLHGLEIRIGSSNDLKCLFVLLLRQYNPNIQNKQYLQDLVITNHIVLSFLENLGNDCTKYGSSMIDHIKQFATVEVMRQYGLLLEDFESNGEYINDCVFTMMHHIAGDLNQVASLFQPNILKTFAQMWEGDFELCDDWSDLIEYVIHRFINLPRQCPTSNTGILPGSPAAETAENSGWSSEDCENLYWYFVQSSADRDPISNIIKLYEENGISKTRIAVIERLAQQGVVGSNQYQDLMKGESLHSVNVSTLKFESLSTDYPSQHSAENDADEIKQLKDMLIQENWGDQLSWLQRLLIEACYVKVVKSMRKEIVFDTVARPLEPIPHYYSILNQSIPVVAWSSAQSEILMQKQFQLLLHKLGFHLPADTGKVFARIPSFWTADVLFSVSQKLGPIDSALLKFDVEYVSAKLEECQNADLDGQKLESLGEYHFAIPRSKHAAGLIRYTPEPLPSARWLDIVKHSKAALTLPLFTSDTEDNNSKKLCSDNSQLYKTCLKESEMEDSDIASVCSICETSRESVASDLTRMCVSDEEEKIEHIGLFTTDTV